MLKELLFSMKHGVKRLLTDNFIGIYLHGSLALGDFNYETSDIDFLVVTEKMLSNDEFSSLEAFHSELRKEYPNFGKRLEGSYIPKDMLREKDPPNHPRPYLNGEKFVWAEYGHEWILERYVLRNYGIILEGVSPVELIPQIESAELKRATINLLCNYWKSMINDVKLSDAEYQVYAVLTMCRVLYTLEYGEIVSKPKAAAWTKKRLDDLFRRLIDEALVWNKKSEFNHLDETRRFIEYVTKKFCKSNSPI